ncbi:MAG: hypothetical protein OXI96_04160 [Acidimicrobiaceae bacterium]|nr:hypothetical protein [Acidimicrobiaceae bacterium]
MNTRVRPTTAQPPIMAVADFITGPHTLLTLKGFGHTSTGVEAFYD